MVEIIKQCRELWAGEQLTLELRYEKTSKISRWFDVTINAYMFGESVDNIYDYEIAERSLRRPGV